MAQALENHDNHDPTLWCLILFPLSRHWPYLFYSCLKMSAINDHWCLPVIDHHCKYNLCSAYQTPLLPWPDLLSLSLPVCPMASHETLVSSTNICSAGETLQTCLYGLRETSKQGQKMFCSLIHHSRETRLGGELALCSSARHVMHCWHGRAQTT